MPVNDQNNEQVGGIQNHTQTQTQTQMGDKIASAFDQNTRRQGTFSFVDIGSLARAPMGRNPQGEILTKLTKALAESYESVGKDHVISVIPVDRNNQIKLTFSVIVVAVQQAGRKDKAAFHTLILEGSTEQLAPRFENFNGRNIEIMKVASDAWDDVLLNVVIDELRRALPKVELANAGACVVPRDFDAENHDLVYKLAANAFLADFTELTQSAPGFIDLNLANAEKDSSLQVRPTFARNEVYDSVGLPIRSDVQVDLLAVQQVRHNDPSVNNGLDRQSLVSSVNGFMDLIWDPLVQQNMGYVVPGQQQMMTQKYLPRFIITQLDPVRLLTIPAQLLALVSAVLLREDNGWVGAFKPKALTGKEIDMHDIGGVGIEANLENNPQGIGTRINTKSDSFRPEMLGQLIGMTMKPGLVMSMDIPECGAQTWYNEVFSSASAGSVRAQQAIIDAANKLTNNAFSQFFPSNGRIFIEDMNKVHMGYYVDRNGIKRDIRDIDYLAVANLVGEKDPGLIRDWSDTFLRTQYPLAQRLAARKQTISGLVTDPVFTGFARRVTFDHQFIDALVQGCRSVGLTIRNTGSFLDTGSFERATGSFFGQAVMGGASTGIFNRDMGYFGTQGSNMFGGFNRW